MKSRCKSKAPPGGIFRWWPGIVLALTLLPLVSARAQQDMEGQEVSSAAGLPGWGIQLWTEVVRTDLWWFGWYSAPLGDINGDGYDDLAVSSRADTTFIFLGGDVFNHQHAYIVRGGSAGIASADFNSDGRMDLVTAVENRSPGERWPEFRGAVRIFLQKDGPSPFTWEGDMLIEGGPSDEVGRNINTFRGSLIVLDYNGDGWPDLLTKANDPRDSVRWKGVLYLGGPAMDAVVDAEFKLRVPLELNQDYIADAIVGDINGDGYDDVLLAQTGPEGPQIGEYWEVFLGNPWAYAEAPQRIIRMSNGWLPRQNWSNMLDVDADGYDDLLGSTCSILYGNAHLFRGSTVLPELIVPNDSIFNYRPFSMGDKWPTCSCPVGDMNGDGTDDLVMGWASYFASGIPYFFYPGGSLFRRPNGWFGTTGFDIEQGVYPAGDLNGDGYADILTLGKGSRSGTGNRFQIWLGARQLSTGVESTPAPAAPTITLSPNPLPSAHRRLHVVAEGARAGTVDVLVTDLLGRVHSSRTCDFTGQTPELTLALPVLPAGVYLLTLRQGDILAQQKLLVF